LVVSAREGNAYKNISLQRTVYMLQLPGGKKLIADIFNVTSASDHEYDLPFQYNGQFINASFKYKADTKKLETLGNRNGYQFLWKEAEGVAEDTTVQFTFLNGRTYYSISSLVQDKTQLFFARTGANDPNFNLRHEPSFIIRKKGSNQVFINAIEIHGNYDNINELSSNSYPSIQRIKLLENDADYSVAEFMVAGKSLLIAQCNKNFDSKAKHSFNKQNINIEWYGPYTVLYQGKKLN